MLKKVFYMGEQKLELQEFANLSDDLQWYY